MTFKEKLSNFMFYHKWHVVIGVLCVVFIVITIVQCTENVETDLSIAYVGHDYIDTHKFEEDVTELIGDINGDGKKYVFCDNVIMPREAKSDADFQMDQKLLMLFADGETRLYIMDKDFFTLDIYAEMFENLEGLIPEHKLEGAYEYNGAKIAVCAKNCAMLEKYGLNKDELYVGIMSFGPKDEKNNEKYNLSVKLIKDIVTLK